LDRRLHSALPQLTEYQTAQQILFLGGCSREQRVHGSGPRSRRS
jgi:hypothetical protein